MASDADLFAEARQHMVDSQIRPNRVTDPRIIAAMRSLPRERFLPASLSAIAYVDEDVPLGNGRVVMEPMILARLLQLAVPAEGERVLVIGAGTGYGSAVLSACGCRVTAVEEDRNLLAIARPVLSEIAPAVTLLAGPLAEGASSGAPYDVILIEGAVHEIPAAVGSQLQNDGGRLVGVICGAGRTCQAVLAEPTSMGLRARPMFDCATAPFPSLLPAPAFEF
ncbi:MAG: protein-L-isoaspartate O-methyltransferase [Acetobacteraceae bacterium]